ncbi:hypothetical protein Cgig2_006674 [Carnegiea gigantea]|uniref:Uncharacterized protein n=1 Tax=Carnegiea gigantea TaxID=171969 RepID=A0A9Q1GP91_9CARY|nr:hypothetical protein Cgig2_006674 [Carnegiea gigantea]
MALPKLRTFQNSLKPHLRALNRISYADLHEQSARARHELDQIQKQMQQDPSDMALQPQEHKCREHYIAILTSSKVEWVKFGDECTRTFFALAKQRKLATYIYPIKDDAGNLVEGGLDHSFYKYLLGRQITLRVPIDKEIISMGAVLSTEQQLHMSKAFTDGDIRDALFSIPNTKSPGPDGYNSGFYKATWHVTGPLICLAVKEFFSKGEMPKFLTRQNPRTLTYLRGSLEKFHECAGLKANEQKSMAVYGGCT